MEWIINHQKVDADFSSKIILSTFSMALLITKITVFGVRRTHVWLAKNKCTHKMSLFSAFGHILDRRYHRTILFWEWGWSNSSVNGARYRDMITQFFLPKLDDIYVANMWFQMPLYSQWNNSITARDISWSCTLSFRWSELASRSHDLTPLDFFLWDYLKSKVYINNPIITHCITRGN